MRFTWGRRLWGVAPLAIYSAHAAILGQWLVDDGLISMAYARAFVETGILTQQPGLAPVEAISNPTWTMLWAGLVNLGLADAGRSLGGVPDYVVATRILGLVLFAATMAGIAWLLRSLAPERWRLPAAVAGTILALSPPYVIWSVAGLENPLYGLCIAGLLAWVARAGRRGTLAAPRTATVAAFVALTAAATRPDGLIYAGVLPLTVLLFGWRRPGEVLRSWLAFVMTYVALAIPLLYLRWTTYGALVSNSVVAKPLGVGWRVLLRPIELLPAGGYVLPIVAVLALIVWARAPLTLAGKQILTALTITAACASFAYCLLPLDWMGEYRFATPLFVTAAIAVGGAFSVAPGGRRRVWVAAALIVAIAATLLPRSLNFAAHATYPGCYVADRYGRLFNTYADQLGLREPVVMIPDLGGSALTARFRIVDLGGLADKKIARMRADIPDWGPDLIAYVVNEAKPDLIAFGPPWDPGFERSARFLADYVSFGSPGTHEYVRRDRVADVSQLIELRALAAHWEPRIEAQWKRFPLASCGAWVRGERIG